LLVSSFVIELSIVLGSRVSAKLIFELGESGQSTQQPFEAERTADKADEPAH
jgi:hypothetical protein